MMLEIKSHAKINLCLYVSGKREDGFHNIETVFQMIDLHDDILFFNTEDRGIHIDVNAKNVPSDENNLAYKAAFMLKNMFNIDKGIKLKIIKRIPVGAGLGGGSSNAAVTLMGLNRIWNLNLSKKELLELGGELGSDVPFFIFGDKAIGRGKGDLLEDIKIDLDGYFLLVNPGIFISSKWAYDELKYRLTNRCNYNKIGELSLLNNSIKNINGNLENDLESAVTKRYPEIIYIKERLKEYGAEISLMTGSGSTVYGLFKKEADASEAKKRLDALNKNWWVNLVKAVKSENQIIN